MDNVIPFAIPTTTFRLSVPAILITFETIDRLHKLVETLGGKMREVNAGDFEHTLDFMVMNSDMTNVKQQLQTSKLNWKIVH